MSTSPDVGGLPARVVRLTFRFDNGTVDLVERRPLRGVAPPSDPLTDDIGEQGFRVEVRSADDRTVYRRVMHDPFDTHVEVFTADPGRPISRASHERDSGTFFVDVPDTEEGTPAPSAPPAAPTRTSEAATTAPSSAPERPSSTRHPVRATTDRVGPRVACPPNTTDDGLGDGQAWYVGVAQRRRARRNARTGSGARPSAPGTTPDTAIIECLVSERKQRDTAAPPYGR